MSCTHDDSVHQVHMMTVCVSCSGEDVTCHVMMVCVCHVQVMRQNSTPPKSGKTTKPEARDTKDGEASSGETHAAAHSTHDKRERSQPKASRPKSRIAANFHKSK